jgi:hypothetical protein
LGENGVFVWRLKDASEADLPNTGLIDDIDVQFNDKNVFDKDECEN